MPYAKGQIPSGTEHVPKHGQRIYAAAFNAAVEKYGEETAHKIAWAATKKRYRKKGEKWVAKDAFDPDQPRDPQGKWTSGGGSGGAERGETSETWQHGANHNHPGEGYSAEARVDEHGVIHTSNVDDAARALYENRKVELNQPREVATLLDRLGAIAKEAIARGEKAPNFDLCNVSVAGTNLFCAESIGIPRVQMPQLADDGKPGDAADFVKWMQGRGYKVSEDQEYASHLRATQNELKGSQVALQAHFLETGEGKFGYDPEAAAKLMDRPIVVSRDNYILDGHHSWAARVGIDARDNVLADDKRMNVRRVDTDIVTLLYAAEDFTGGKGHKSAKDRHMRTDAWSEAAREASAAARAARKKEKEKRGKASEWVGGYRVQTPGWKQAHVQAYGHTRRWGSHGDGMDKEFSAERRKELAKSGKAMPGGGFPIENKGDLANAIRAFGRAGNKAAAKAHIKKRARALGATEMLPENWDASHPSNQPLYDDGVIMGGIAKMRELQLDWAATDADDTCPTCGGTGEDDDGDECPTCGGSGYVEDADPDEDDDDDEDLEDAARISLNDRVDVVFDGKPRKTKDGYLVASARISRTGIQEYGGTEVGRPDLSIVRVYRPPEEVFSHRSLKSLAHKPVTLDHPPIMVDAGNWKEYAVGYTGDEVSRDGDCVRIPMMITDARAIEAYEKFGVRELSVGYSTDLKWEKGKTPSGETYDAIQTRIRGNHLAVVPAARGGSQLKIGDDGKGDTAMTVRILIDGRSVDFGDEAAANYVQTFITKITKDLADAKKKADEAEEEQEEEKKTRGENDALKGEIAVLKKQLEDAKAASGPAAIDAAVKERLEVVSKAVAATDNKIDFTGKELADIRRIVVTSQLGDAVRTMSDGEISGAFKVIASTIKPKTGTDRLADSLSGLQFGGGGTDIKAIRDAAYAERNKQLSEAWKMGRA